MDYKVVDVFTSEPLKGNPVAVVLDGNQLSTDEMQSIARWTNLSETTFVVDKTSADADYRVRIFTPVSELPFAGHPSLGTAHALVEAKIIEKKPVIIQQCGRGNISIEMHQDKVQFGIDGITSDSIDIEELKNCLPELNIQGVPRNICTGPFWVVVEVSASTTELLEYKPDFAKIAQFSESNHVTGICVYCSSGPDGDDIELRTFAPAVLVNEDPVCGSGNAAVAYYRNLGRQYTTQQGSALHRNGQISLAYRDGKIWVGGSCVTVVNGKINV